MKGEAASVFLCAASTYGAIDDKAGFFGWLTKDNPFARKEDIYSYSCCLEVAIYPSPRNVLLIGAKPKNFCCVSLL